MCVPFLTNRQQRIDSKKPWTPPNPPLCVCVRVSPVSPSCFRVPLCYLSSVARGNKQTNNLPFYFLNLNNIIKANPELPFYYHSSNSQQWKVKGKIQEIRMCSFFIPPKMSLNDFFCYLVNDDKVHQHRKYLYLRKYRIFCWIKSYCRFFHWLLETNLSRTYWFCFCARSVS